MSAKYVTQRVMFHLAQWRRKAALCASLAYLWLKKIMARKLASGRGVWR